ncbi:SCO2522 family protein [Phytohabitans rumicis]|nr:SCO2522 family protein [Phytohabitans rumicis]
MSIFEEGPSATRVASLPLSHLSVQLGHVPAEDLSAGPGRLRHHFRLIAPWLATARDTVARVVPGGKTRISTCFVVDDYHLAPPPPAEVLPMVIDAARASDISIDYIVRSSACAGADGISPVQILLDHIVEEPAVGSNGTRPPVQETGWLSNGRRSPSAALVDPVSLPSAWAPPAQHAPRGHSIFLDVELWNDISGRRVWSDALLASAVQMLRLGLLRYQGQPVHPPHPWDGEFPADWDLLPPVLRVNPTAAPFSAYRTSTVLDSRLTAEAYAVRTILGQVAVNAAVVDPIRHRAVGETLDLPFETVDRIVYVFVG